MGVSTPPELLETPLLGRAFGPLFWHALHTFSTKEPHRRQMRLSLLPFLRGPRQPRVRDTRPAPSTLRASGVDWGS